MPFSESCGQDWVEEYGHLPSLEKELDSFIKRRMHTTQSDMPWFHTLYSQVQILKKTTKNYLKEKNIDFLGRYLFSYMLQVF